VHFRRAPHSLRARRAKVALIAAGLVFSGMFGALASGVALADNPPPNPTDQQLNDAAQQKDALAANVGDLTAQLANLQAQVDELSAKRDLAEQKLALAMSQLDDAKAKATAANDEVKAAEQGVQNAQTQFIMYAQAVYMTGSVAGTTGTLLTASDPSALLDSSALQQYQTSHQLTAIGQLQQATVAKSNAQAAARKAVQDQATATAKATQAKDVALAAFNDAQSQQAALAQQQATVQSQLDAAQQNLATLNNQRAAWTTWHNHQLWLAHQAYLKRQREIAAAKAAAAARAAAAKLAAEQAARQAAQQNNSNNSGSGGSSGSNTPAPSSYQSVPVPTGGSWSSSKASQAVRRALNWLGEDYIWAGGNGGGPTTGGCTDPIAPCGTVGFDCSGLVLYAWAPYISMAHYAATQFTQAGSFHPSSGQFQPGDLLFWSYDGTIGGIHHVAMYIGGGMVVQAPESGDVVRETPWDQVSGGYFGATRPLT
jgi:cell wall-associated NlpC family hydrolase